VRIAHVVSSYHPQVGGVEMHVRRIVEGCSAAGDEITVLTHTSGKRLVQESVNSIRVLRFPLAVRSPNYAFSPALFRYLPEHADEFDLVHSHSYHTLVGQAAIRTRLPMIFTPHYHGTGHTPFRAALHRVYRPIGARLFVAAQAIICVSAAERDQLVRDFPGAARKITVIPNGTDRRSRLVEPEGGVSTVSTAPVDHVVLTVGRLEPYKNLALFIKAFRALRVPATLVIVGDGPDRMRLEQIAEDTRPGWPIRFTGRISDQELDGLLSRSAVVTSASDHEAFGLMLADGLASGARVVASDIPAHREVGRLAGSDAPISFIDPRNASQYATAMESALSGNRVEAGLVRLPTWAEVVDETRELYARVKPILRDGNQVVREDSL
jgi:glycosyltransferase involved in cell wall biosynthesis